MIKKSNKSSKELPLDKPRTKKNWNMKWIPSKFIFTNIWRNLDYKGKIASLLHLVRSQNFPKKEKEIRVKSVSFSKNFAKALNKRSLSIRENWSFVLKFVFHITAKQFRLIHYSPVLLFYTPWKHQKTFRFSEVFWCFQGV